MPKRNIIFDSQILNSVQMCALRTDLYFHRNLRVPEPAVPLQTGDLLHQMLEKYYLVLKEMKTELVYSDEAFEKVLAACISFGEEYSAGLSINASEVDEVIKHFTENIRFHRMDGMTVKDVESVFIVPILADDEELGIYYSGKIDLICELPEEGELVVDHKSARRATEPDPLSNQFTGYAYATGIRNVMINRIGFQKTLKPADRFKRPVIRYSKEQIERWRQNTIWWGRQYAFFLDTGQWPENRTSCDKFGGCLFHRICNSATEEARDWIIKSAYVVGETWDPTKNLKEANNE